MGLIILTLLGLKYLPGWVKLVWLFHEFTVTRRLALRINLVTLCMGFTAVCVEQHPTTALISVLCAGYLVHRVNKSDKEGGKK